MVWPLIIFLAFTAMLYFLIKEEDSKAKTEAKDTKIDCSKVEVRECEFGLGCFANKHIAKGETVEIGLMTPMPGVDGNKYEHMFTWSDDRQLFAVGSGCLPYYNHSDQPNIIKVGDLTNNTMRIVALRDIHKGEEMRNRYMSKAWRGCFQNF